MVKAGARSEWVRVMSLNGYSTVQFSVDNGRMTSAEAVNSVEIVSIQYYVEMLQFNCDNQLLTQWYRVCNNMFFLLGCLGCMCPPLANSMVAEKINSDGIESWIGLLDFLGGGFLFWCGGSGICSAIGATILRGKIRERDGIEGDRCEDCFTSFCCLPCAQCQLADHVGLFE